MKLFSLLLSLLTFILYNKPRSTFFAISFWTPKLLAGAFSPLLAILGALTGIYGMFKRDWGLASIGIGNAALEAAHVKSVSKDQSDDLFSAVFGPDWQTLIPPQLQANFLPQPYQPLMPSPEDVIFQQDLIVGEKFGGGPLHADLWQPKAGAYRSGMAIIYTHGGAWRYGNKDMMTRSQFRWLAYQGHVILDIDYSISEDTPVQEMVRETKQALLWMKQHANDYQIDPNRIVLMGGSAGGQLALLTAYTPGHLAFQPEMLDDVRWGRKVRPHTPLTNGSNRIAGMVWHRFLVTSIACSFRSPCSSDMIFSNTCRGPTKRKKPPPENSSGGFLF